MTFRNSSKVIVEDIYENFLQIRKTKVFTFLM